MPKNEIRKLCINADDFAQSEVIDDAIVDLAKRGIITSTSALVLSPAWAASAQRLKDLPIQVGLHLDLTSHFTPAFGFHYSLPRLIFLACIRALSKQDLKKIIELQWFKFTEVYGSAPDFIDGHQHIHQLPVVRDALLSVIAENKWGSEPNQWLRVCRAQRWQGVKAMVISSLGAKSLQFKASQMNIATNTDFAGVYNFDEKCNLEKNWRRWLGSLSGNKPLVMCHVAVASQSVDFESGSGIDHDEILRARVNEYNWLKSKEFKLLLKAKHFS